MSDEKQYSVRNILGAVQEMDIDIHKDFLKFVYHTMQGEQFGPYTLEGDNLSIVDQVFGISEKAGFEISHEFRKWLLQVFPDEPKMISSTYFSMEKSIRDWMSCVHPGFEELVYKYVTPDTVIKARNSGQALIGAFSFSESDEGSDFWVSVSVFYGAQTRYNELPRI
jgi:hypothetical protein